MTSPRNQSSAGALAEADLFRVTIGAQWGGLGLGDVEASIVLEEIARERKETLSHLVAAIDSERQQSNLSSSIRLFVLADLEGRGGG